MSRKMSLLLIVVLGFFSPFGCSRKPAPAGSAPPPAQVVSVVKPEMRAIQRVVEQPGTVMAFEETSLHSKLTGFIAAIEEDPNKKDHPEYDRFIDINSRVKANQVLARIAIPELDEEFNQKTALVKQADAEIIRAEKTFAAGKANVEAASAMIGEVEAGLERAQALYETWQKEADRIAKLVSGGVGDLQTRDQTQNQLRAAEAARKEARARITSTKAAVIKAIADRDKANADVDAARAHREVAAADARRVDAQRTYLVIRSPFDGVVTRRAANRGELVSANEKAALFRVARIDPLRVVVNVPEADAGLVAIGQKVNFSLQVVAHKTMIGTVARTSWSLEPGSRTLRTEIDLPNENGQLRPGMYAYATITAELPAAWTVPATAIGRSNDEPFLYLVENGKAVRVAVELLHGDGQHTQIGRYRRTGTSEWSPVSGAESIATPASAIADGQEVK